MEQYTYGQPRAGNEQFTQWITNQGGNYRITHTSDFICNLPPETGYGVYRHISPEYWIKSGYGQENDIVKIEGLSNRNGVGSASGMNILAHIGYFQRNMYKCVISII
jgi:triacylglycerol lipase